MNKPLGILIAVIVLLSSCRGNPTAATHDEGDTLALKYATHLSVVRYHDHTVVKLADPWNSGKTLHTYVLVPADQKMPAHLPEGAVVRTPLKKAVVATSVHCSLIIDMGRGGHIGGVCEPQYIHIPYILERLAKKEVVDCGSGMAPTVEKIIELQPDAIFLSPFQNSGGYGKVEELNIPIIETADYMETSALGRAEWMRFYGLLFGCEETADSLFAEVENNYLRLKEQAKTSQGNPSLLMDKQTGSVWYVPGGQSTIGGMIADAHIGYAWHGDDHSGSLALPFESVLEQAGDADIWLFRYNAPHDMTMRELLTDKDGYKQFRAFVNHQVYGCNTATSKFYEETPFHPHLLLRDFICIAHPDLQLGEPRYFIKLHE
jgi:iron complex transport system substrate-binding protein